MNATVKAVRPDVGKRSAAGKFYKVTEFVVDTDKGEKTYNVFSKDPCHNDILRLSPGTNVKLALTQNGQYQNLSGVSVAEASSSAPAPSGGGSNFAERNLEIRRAVALKAAIELTAAKGGKDVQKMADEALTLCPLFELYLSGEEIPAADMDEAEAAIAEMK